MKQQLDAQIIALETKSDSVTETLGTGVFVDAHAPTDTVATEMSAAKNRLEGCRRLKNRYTDYQDLFEVGVAFQFAQFTAADETFEKRDLLWNLVSTFAESRRNWLSQDFAELDVNDVQTETEDVFMKAHKLHKKFQGDVSKKLLDSVKAFRADVPTIVELGNPSMQPEHWDQIYKIMNIEPEQAMQMDFTLNTLIDSGIMDFKKEVSDISGTASGQVSCVLGCVCFFYFGYFFTSPQHAISQPAHSCNLSLPNSLASSILSPRLKTCGKRWLFPCFRTVPAKRTANTSSVIWKSSLRRSRTIRWD